MGIVHQICQLTGLGITSEQPDVSVVLVAPEHGVFQPIAVPIFGHYNDYGVIEKPVLLDGDRACMTGLLAMHRRGELTWTDTAEISDDVSEANLVAILEEIRQGMIYEAVRRADQPSLLMRAGGVPIHQVFILESFYEAVVSLQRSALSDEEQDRLDELVDGPFAAVAGPLGDSALASQLVTDTPRVRDQLVELALFRSWFDPRCKWTPASTGSQLGPRDLEARARAARGTLAQWPSLVRCVDRYESKLR